MTGEIRVVVDDGMTAASAGSGLVAGLGTPYLVALLENASLAAIAEAMQDGQSSVGTRVDIEHLAPTPVGMTVIARARLEEIDRRRLVFAVSAEDEVGEIARGRHERFLIDLSAFEDKMQARGR